MNAADAFTTAFEKHKQASGSSTGHGLRIQPSLDAAVDKERLVQRRPNMGSRSSSTVSLTQIQRIVSGDGMETETYGVSELREGFFDALFLRPSPLRLEELREKAQAALPDELQDDISLLRPRQFAQKQWHKLSSEFIKIVTTRVGIRLFKAFLAFFIAYILCLVPTIRDWLGRYNYVMVVSTIVNHPARTVGSQIDGAVLTTIGTAAGLGWGVVALLLSTSTLAASAGYGGILALFLALFMTIIALMRSFLERLYQGVLCAGIAITFTCLAETSSRDVEWSKLRSYAVPWMLGQAIALLVNCMLFPDAGARPLAATLHDFFGIAQEALITLRARDPKLRRMLSQAYIDISTAYRDMRIDMTVTRFHPDDVRDLRNHMLTIVRALLSLNTETDLLNDEPKDTFKIHIHPPASSDNLQSPVLEKPALEEDPSREVTRSLAAPTKDLLDCVMEGLSRSDAALMDLSGYRKHLGPSSQVSSDMAAIQARLEVALTSFDASEDTILQSGRLPLSSIQNTEVIHLLMFARRVRETAASIMVLLEKVENMQNQSDWPRLYLPSYPLSKAVHRTNKQVRHDRGGITASSYKLTFSEISEILEKMASRDHKPSAKTRPGTPEPDDETLVAAPTMDAEVEEDPNEEQSKGDALGFKIWRVLRRLQGYESFYAFKVCLMTSLLSVPSYLDYTTEWWDRYEVWWAVSMSWIMMHPRVGGNVSDLVIRSFCAILGALWSGAAYAAGRGNPYVLAVFAALFMIPMLHRFIHSSHPRSGLVGCISFSVISLGLQNYKGDAATNILAVAKGLSFLIGTAVPILVNWVLWPFVARHELRFALSSMLFFMSIIYRNVVAKYVYFEEGKAPTAEDIRRSEILEGRLREGFVRIRQLIVLTRHEIRLRGPFDPLPYAALTDACDHFFEYLIALRQSAIFYNPGYVRDHSGAAEKLLGYRRDAVAAILGNLYILAGALRSKRKVPRYLPSGAAARQKLLMRTIELENEMAAFAKQDDSWERKKWADIYSYSYRESLTGCVTQLEELEKYTKLITGEQWFDDEAMMDDDAVE